MYIYAYLMSISFMYIYAYLTFIFQILTYHPNSMKIFKVIE